MDTGRFSPSPQSIPLAFEDELRGLALGDNIVTEMCPDIKIDVPPYQMNVSDVDYLAFGSILKDKTPGVMGVPRVCVQVHNRGTQPGNNVTVKIFWTILNAGLIPPYLPADFWTAFPNDSIDTSHWLPIGSPKTITYLSNTEPTVLEWDWLAGWSTQVRICILVVVDFSQDPIPSSNKIFDVDNLALLEKHVSYKIVKGFGPL
jgi:hypothetical protein